MLYPFWVNDSLRTLKVHHCSSLYVEGCMELHGGVQRGAQSCAEGCKEVYRGVCAGVLKGAQRRVEGCTRMFVLGYHWLTLATIDLVCDNRESEV